MHIIVLADILEYLTYNLCKIAWLSMPFMLTLRYFPLLFLRTSGAVLPPSYSTGVCTSILMQGLFGYNMESTGTVYDLGT
jgi:hypothetical protein